jgi:hypothetical protein
VVRRLTKFVSKDTSQAFVWSMVVYNSEEVTEKKPAGFLDVRVGCECEFTTVPRDRVTLAMPPGTNMLQCAFT